VALQEMEGDPEILTKIDDAESLLRSLRKASSCAGFWTPT
jgi:hypothetical protein